MSEVDVVGLKAVRAGAEVLGFHPEVAQQVDELVDVDDVWKVVDGHRLVREHHRTQDLQRLVFGPLRCDLPMQLVAAFNDETSHDPEFRGGVNASLTILTGFSTPEIGKVVA